ncbi:hypothetical protein [Sphingomonas humi]
MIDVEAGDPHVPGERDGQGQADIAEADDDNMLILQQRNLPPGLLYGHKVEGGHRKRFADSLVTKYECNFITGS